MTSGREWIVPADNQHDDCVAGGDEREAVPQHEEAVNGSICVNRFDQTIQEQNIWFQK